MNMKLVEVIFKPMYTNSTVRRTLVVPSDWENNQIINYISKSLANIKIIRLTIESDGFLVP